MGICFVILLTRLQCCEVVLEQQDTELNANKSMLTVTLLTC